MNHNNPNSTPTPDEARQDTSPDQAKGSSYQFIGRNYTRGNTQQKLQVGDEVIIHPIPGVSQAKKSYPAKIVEMRLEMYESGVYKPLQLVLQGTGDNAGWYGAVLNEYGFNRLEPKSNIAMPVFTQPKLIGNDQSLLT